MSILFPEIQQLSDFDIIKDKDALIVDICYSLNKFSKKILDGEDGNSCFAIPIDDAPIIGLFNKIRIMFLRSTEAFERKEPDSIVIFQRILYEAIFKMLFLIDNPEQKRVYRAIGFKATLQTLREIGTDNPITKVLEYKFNRGIKEDGLNIDEIDQAPYKLGGVSIRNLMSRYISNKAYAPLYSMPSDSIHSGWNEIRQFYLFYDEDSNQHVCDSDYSVSIDYRYIAQLAALFYDALTAFLTFIENLGFVLTDTFNIILSDIKRVIDICGDYTIKRYDNNPESCY